MVNNIRNPFEYKMNSPDSEYKIIIILLFSSYLGQNVMWTNETHKPTIVHRMKNKIMSIE